MITHNPYDINIMFIQRRIFFHGSIKDESCHREGPSILAVYAAGFAGGFLIENMKPFYSEKFSVIKNSLKNRKDI